MSEQAFLDAICAHPEDATPRLVFADWLDDHGASERAELIRTAHALRQGDKQVAARVDSLLSGVYLLEPDTAASRLREAGFALAEVLWRYAGPAPDYPDVLPQAVLVAWCRVAEPTATTPSNWLGFGRRFDAIRLIKNDPQVMARFVSTDAEVRRLALDAAGEVVRRGTSEPIDFRSPHWADLNRRTLATANRDRKRRVLRLFPEVMVVREWSPRHLVRQDLTEPVYGPSYGQAIRDHRYVGGYLLVDGERVELPCEIEEIPKAQGGGMRVRKEVKAPDLIPPEPMLDRFAPRGPVEVRVGDRVVGRTDGRTIYVENGTIVR